MIYALDTNTISYLLKKDITTQDNFMKVINDGNEYVVPPMVYFEVMRWLILKNANSKILAFKNLCKYTNNFIIDIFTFDKAIEIYATLVKTGQIIDDSDILIASYCIINDYTLVTNNTKHFKNINGLKIVNWK